MSTTVWLVASFYRCTYRISNRLLILCHEFSSMLNCTLNVKYKRMRNSAHLTREKKLDGHEKFIQCILNGNLIFFYIFVVQCSQWKSNKVIDEFVLEHFEINKRNTFHFPLKNSMFSENETPIKMRWGKRGRKIF